MAEFARDGKSYLTRVKIDEKEVAAINDSALEQIRKAEKEKAKFNSFVFNKKKIAFVKNEKVVEMCNIGVVKYEGVGDYDFIEDLDFVNGGKSVQVYPQDDGSLLYLLCIDANGYLTQVTLDKDKKFI